jgi:acetyl-CoA acetyltransferase
MTGNGDATPPLNAAIVGAAITPVGVWPEETTFSLAATALVEALDDAGLERDQLDGYVWNLGRPSGEDYDALVTALGLKARFVTQFWTHGRFTGSAVLTAAMAVTMGLADYVVCLGGTKRRPGGGPAAAAFGNPPHGDLSSYGMTSFIHEAAMAFQSYLAITGADRERLADVVLATRDHAARNDLAWLREPLTAGDYAASPLAVEPLRLLDCFPFGANGSPQNDYGACVIVARGDLARALDRPPIHIVSGQGVQAGRQETYFGRPGLGIFGQTTDKYAPGEWDQSVYRRAGMEPDDVDLFYTYDCFAPLVWMVLERYGHCPAGEASTWATRERIGPGGSFPVNTNGGLLSQGHTAGWGHMVELTRQLRGEAGDRQVDGAKVAQWGAIFGDSLLFTNDDDRMDR